MLGYVVALANERGGLLVLGMEDAIPHEVCGTDFAAGKTGNLEDEIYKRLGIRINTKEIQDNYGRVLVISVPSRPIGKLLKYEGVALMRTGESLREMSDMEMFAILSEQEPDFSQKVCPGLSIADLDEEAIALMKNRYAQKQNNLSFQTLSTQQVLKDLGLLVNGKLNYAALILLAKKEKIHELLPQCNIVIEYRQSPSMIPYTDRVEIQEPLFLAIDKAWNYINQPASNPLQHIEFGPYIMDVRAFNEKCVREGLINAMCHRMYQLQSDVVVLQSPKQISITSGGGLPLGVCIENIMDTNSTPRNRRMCEVLEKTGLVERSGQGVDKIFAEMITDGKSVPSYYGTDAYQVKLTLTSEIENPALHIYALEEQSRRDADHQLNAFQLFALYSISKGEKPKVDEKILQSMVSEGLIIINNKSNKEKYEMNADYLLIISRISERVSKNSEQVGEQVSEQVKMLVLALCTESSLAVLMSELRLNSRQYFMRKYLNPAIEAGFIELTQPESPNSPKQKYRLSKRGIELQKLLYGEVRK